MGKVVLGHLKKLDKAATLTNIEVVKTVEELEDHEVTYVLDATADHLAQVQSGAFDVYMPSTLLKHVDENTEGIYVYFDLENYAFYQKAKELMQQAGQPKGVFRFRRTVDKHEDLLLIGDLYVISELLGEIKSIEVKRTDLSVIPSHTIMMVNFGGGMMAHIEYTVSDHQRIDLEWSGVKQIIEFNSDELRPIQPGHVTKLPLMFTVDAVMETAWPVNQVLLDRLDELGKLISGGEAR